MQNIEGHYFVAIGFEYEGNSTRAGAIPYAYSHLTTAPPDFLAVPADGDGYAELWGVLWIQNA
jgi:hypothetical protein